MNRPRLDPDVRSFIWKLTQDDKLLSLLEWSLGRVMMLERQKNSVFSVYSLDEDRVRHVVDWLTAAVATEEQWLTRLDAEGVPKKLRKFGSFEQLVREADKATAKAIQKMGKPILQNDDEAFVEQLDDGFYLVRLLTPQALDKESVEMQHCIGGGAYDDNVASPGYEYLSLRDKFGKAHATIEIAVEGAGNQKLTVTQFQGKQNSLPQDRYLRLVGPFFKSRAVAPFQMRLKTYDVHFQVHDIQNLPEGVTTGPLRLNSFSELVLPSLMTVNGNLYIQNCQRISLPQNLNVQSDLVITNTTVKSPSESIQTRRLILCGDGAGETTLTRNLSTKSILARAVIIGFWGHGIDEFTPNLNSKSKRSIKLGVDYIEPMDEHIEIDDEIELPSSVDKLSKVTQPSGPTV